MALIASDKSFAAESARCGLPLSFRNQMFSGRLSD
jgi:hypothetical protein